MNIVAITAHRVKELQEPLAELEHTTCLTVADVGLIRRYFTIIFSGSHAIRRESPEVIIADGGDVVGFLTLVLGFIYRTPVVVRLKGDHWTTRAQKRRDQLQAGNYSTYLILLTLLGLNRFAFRFADGFIVLSDELKQITEQQTSIPSSKIRVVPQHIDLHSVEKTSQKYHHENGFGTELLTVTNLQYKNKYQGICDIIEELQPLLEKNGSICYSIAGDGMYLKDLKKDLRDPSLSSIRDQIKLLGYVENIHEIYRNADVFIYISYLDGYPNVVLEAQANKLPVVANAAHGMLMQIEDGETGFLIDPNEAGQCRSRVQHLIDNPEEASRLGVQAYQRVRKENSVEMTAQKLHDALNQIVGS